MKAPLTIKVVETGHVYAYSCGECGTVFSTGVDSDEGALLRAHECCAPITCHFCRAVMPPRSDRYRPGERQQVHTMHMDDAGNYDPNTPHGGRYIKACEACEKRIRGERDDRIDREHFEKARKTPMSEAQHDGDLQFFYWEGHGRDGYLDYDYLVDEICNTGEVPEYIFATEREVYRFDLLDQMKDDLDNSDWREDASGDLPSKEQLKPIQDALDTLTASVVQYEPNFGHVILLDNAWIMSTLPEMVEREE